MTSKEMAKIAASALDEKKGVDLRIIDISEVSIMTDYFIVVSGNSDRQVQALADAVQDELGKVDVFARNVEGYHGANWILLDFNDVVVHIFDQENRAFYDIERIWRDGTWIPANEFLA